MAATAHQSSGFGLPNILNPLPTSTIPQRRGRSHSVDSSSSIEIVELSAEEAHQTSIFARRNRLAGNRQTPNGDLQFPGQARTRGPPTTAEIIEISSDDDDAPQVPQAPARRGGPPRRALFSPPPPPPDANIPPIPRWPAPFQILAPAGGDPAQAFPVPQNPRPAPPRNRFGGVIITQRAPAIPHRPLQMQMLINRVRESAAQGFRWMGQMGLPGLEGIDLLGPGTPDDLLDDIFANLPVEEQVPDYEPPYTHPFPPVAGFSHDLASEDTITVLDDSGEFREEQKNQTVCAQCLDPLYMNGSDEDGMRLYGLRCGHILDAKCVAKLFKPEAQAIEDVLPVKPDRKGKGKAKQTYYEPLPEEEQGEDGGADMEFADMPLPRTRPQAGARGRGRGRGRGGRKAPAGRRKGKGLDIIARHEWHCPVTDCYRLHISNLISEPQALSPVWKQDPEKGAIALYL